MVEIFPQEENEIDIFEPRLLELEIDEKVDLEKLEIEVVIYPLSGVPSSSEEQKEPEKVVYYFIGNKMYIHIRRQDIPQKGLFPSKRIGIKSYKHDLIIKKIQYIR